MNTATPRHRPSGNDADRFRMLIAGAWVEALDGEHFSCTDPYTEASWGQVPLARAADVERAVQAARQSFDSGTWPQLPAARRAELLRKLGALIATNAEALACQQIRENGKLISELLSGCQVLARACHYFAGLAETLGGMTLPGPYPHLDCYTLREPLGVVAIITPWNSPLLLLGWKLFPALAAGNTVVIKPSEITPTSTLLLGRLIVEAGFPAGVVNIVTGYGDPAGAALVSHPGIDKIAFTGSNATGRKIAHVAAERQVRTTFELGGKSPNIVFADANPDHAVNGVMAGIFAASGQSCMAGSRVLVQQRIYDEFAALLVARGSRMLAGDPLDPDTQLGPVAFKGQRDKILSYFELARLEGLELLCGGKALERRGFFVAPTVYSHVDNRCRLAREEIFGPVVALMPFGDEDEAVALANDSEYGLAAGVWTEELRLAQRMCARLRAGTVWVNNYRQVSYAVPFGGYRHSGLGRELGPDALAEFTEMKSVWIDTGNPLPFRAG